jgi:hypothetical protein
MASSVRNAITYGQARRVLEFIDEVAPTNTMLQNLLQTGNVLQAIAECPDLTRIDIDEVLRLFREPSEPSWVDFETQFRLMRARVALMRWPLKEYQYGMLVTEEYAMTDRPQLSDRMVQSLDIWLGTDMEDSWAEMTGWLEESLGTVGMVLRNRVAANQLYMRGPALSYLARAKTPVLEHAFIDLDRIAVPRNAFLQELGEYRPRLDLLVLLATNPSMCKLMGTKLPAGLAMTGFCDEQSQAVPIVERYRNAIIIDWLHPN